MDNMDQIDNTIQENKVSSFFKKVLILCLLGFLVHLAFIYYFPHLKMWMIAQKSEANNVINLAFHRDVPNANTRNVIRPSPDLMYSGCGYDVTYAPLAITAEIPETYWSISFFSKNTDNFSTINDEQINGKKVKIYLFGPNSMATEIEDGLVIISPSDKGLMLIRQFIGNGSQLESLYENQASLECYSLNN